MYNITGYLFIVVLILFLGTLFAISIQCDNKRIQKIAERERKKLNILCDLIELDQKIRLNNIHKNPYLLQIDSILENDPFEIDNKKIIVCKQKKDNDIDKKIYKSYKKAPAVAKTAMVELSDILGKIYELNHPIKFKAIELKKNIVLHFLLFIVKMCCFLIKRLEKREECKKNQKKIKNLKEQQKKVQKYPRTILLKGFEPMPLAEAS